MIKRKKLKLTDHVSYFIMDSTVYLFQKGDNIPYDELDILYKKLNLVIQDNDVNYINITACGIEKRKEFYQKLGFSLSYYDVNKLNYLYDGVKNKESYRCYGIMTRNDFFDRWNDEKDNNKNEDRKIVTSYSSGFIYNMFLLFGGIIFLCFLCVQGAIYLVK